MAGSKFTCETCVFWQDQNISGTCRRYPRSINTAKSNWCGEYLSELKSVEERPKRKYTRRTDAKAAEE